MTGRVRKAAPFARIAVTTLVVVVLVRLVDWRAAFEIVRSTEPRWFLGAVGVAAIDRLLMIGKWIPLVRVHLPSASVSRIARVYLATGVAGVFLPASIGDGLLRATALGRPHKKIAEVGAAIVIERVVAVSALALICLGSLGLITRTALSVGPILPWLVAIIVIGVFAMALPMNDTARAWVRRKLPTNRANRWLHAVRKFSVAYASYRSHKTMVLTVAVLSVVEQLLPILIFWFLAKGMGLGVNLSMLAMTIPLVLVASRLPISLGGIGVTEGALVYLLVSFGVPGPQALALGLGGRIVDLIALSPGVLFLGDLVINPGEAGPDVKGSEHTAEH